MIEKETHNTEFKLDWQDDYLRWICGFANAHGGILYLGVDDDGRVVGLRNAKKLMEDIPNKVKNTMGLALDISLLDEEGKEYIEIVVPSVSYPVSYKGEYHYRSGATKQQLTGNELTRFIIRRTGYQWDAEPMPNVKIQDLDQESFDIFRREALRRSRLEETDLNVSRKELLRKLELLTDDGKLTRAAVLLFHRTPEKYISGAYIKVARFSGPDIAYMDELHGSLMIQADRILDLVYTKYMYMRISYYDNRVREERYSVPQLAMREALFNALMHTDYAQYNPIQVRIEDDRVRIANSAQVPEGWTARTFLSPHESKPYNRRIARAFFRAGFVETWGRGIEKICTLCEQEGHPRPRFLVQPTTVTIEFAQENKNCAQENPARYLISDVEPIDYKVAQENKFAQEKKNFAQEKYARITADTVMKLTLCIKENPTVTIAELSQKLNISPRSVQNQLNALRERGILRREGSTKSGRWVLIEYSTIEK